MKSHVKMKKKKSSTICNLYFFKQINESWKTNKEKVWRNPCFGQTVPHPNPWVQVFQTPSTSSCSAHKHTEHLSKHLWHNGFLSEDPSVDAPVQQQLSTPGAARLEHSGSDPQWQQPHRGNRAADLKREVQEARFWGSVVASKPSRQSAKWRMHGSKAHHHCTLEQGERLSLGQHVMLFLLLILWRSLGLHITRRIAVGPSVKLGGGRIMMWAVW